MNAVDVALLTRDQQLTALSSCERTALLSMGLERPVTKNNIQGAERVCARRQDEAAQAAEEAAWAMHSKANTP